MKKHSQAKGNRAKIILALVTFIIAIACIVPGCDPIKRAENRIKGSEQAVNDIGKIWALKNPCVNDTVSRSSIDTTTLHDTIYHYSPAVVLSQPPDHYLYDTLVEKINSVSYIRDTITNTVTDTRALNIQIQKGRDISVQLSKLQNNLSAETGLAKKRWWIIFAIIAALTLTAAITVYLKIRAGAFNTAAVALNSKF